MKKLTILAACLAAALPTLPAQTFQDTFGKHWKTSKEFTLAVAEAMPAEFYSFRPNEEEMSFGQLMAHIAVANNSAFATAAGIKPPAVPEKIAAARKDPAALDKATAIQFLTDSFDFCANTLQNADPEKLRAMSGPEGRQMSGQERIWSYFTHTAHHRGQAEVYLRVKNIKPPAYRF